MTEFKIIFMPHAALQFISIYSASNEGVKLIKSPGQKDDRSPNAWKEAQGKIHIVTLYVIRSPLYKVGRREVRRPWRFLLYLSLQHS